MPLSALSKRTIPNTQGELLKTGEAAARLHISPQTLRDWSDSGKITTVIADSGHRTYYEAEVKRVALAEAGITQYWQANLIIGLKADTSGVFITENYTQTTDFTEALQVWAEDYTRFWDYTNYNQVSPHTAALNDQPTLDPTSYDAIGLAEDSAGENCVTMNLRVVGRTRTGVVDAIKQEAGKAIAHLRANYTPKINYDWYDSGNTKVSL